MKNRGMVFVLILLTLVLATGMPAAEGDPSGEFQEILGKLQRQSRTATPYAFVDQAEKLLFGFLEKYPESPEAAKAHFTLGRVYSSIGKHKDAVEHINNYLTAKIERIPSHEALARYFLAASHLALENFDTSEKLLRELVSNDRLDRRLSEMAQRELARIGTLRKLGIGAPAIGFSA
ncbi:MAG: tetratricopeptide repeat protein, partial [Candidatus Krumholzibacteria bacterium]|nr:tetratricopeptide repeat protein [Candidatus Krumholzibacteria bacterium]